MNTSPTVSRHCHHPLLSVQHTAYPYRHTAYPYRQRKKDEPHRSSDSWTDILLGQGAGSCQVATVRAGGRAAAIQRTSARAARDGAVVGGRARTIHGAAVAGAIHGDGLCVVSVGGAASSRTREGAGCSFRTIERTTRPRRSAAGLAAVAGAGAGLAGHALIVVVGAGCHRGHKTCENEGSRQPFPREVSQHPLASHTIPPSTVWS